MSSGLTDLARWTGGDIFIAIAPAHTSIAARQIVGEMRHQYMLAFEASSRTGWRPLEVKAKDREHVVRARSGYTAGGGTTPSADTVQRDKVRQDEQTDDDERRRAVGRRREQGPGSRPGERCNADPGHGTDLAIAKAVGIDVHRPVIDGGGSS